jgi:hypothetical protein
VRLACFFGLHLKKRRLFSQPPCRQTVSPFPLLPSPFPQSLQAIALGARMPIRVLEQFVRGKQADQSLCEDRLVVTSHFVAVIDGVTSKSAYTWQGESSGVHAGKLIEQVLEKADPAISFDALLDEINHRFQALYATSGLSGHMAAHPIDRLQACLCVYSLGRNELWFVGDCQALVAGVLYAHPKKSTCFARNSAR